MNPACIDVRFFFACGSSAPVRVEHEGGAAAWLAGTLVVPNVQGHRLPLWKELWPYQSFSIALPIQALRKLPYLGPFSVVQHVRHIEGSPWLGSYSVVQCIRRLMGQPLYCSASDAGVWRERGYGDGSTPYV